MDGSTYHLWRYSCSNIFSLKVYQIIMNGGTLLHIPHSVLGKTFCNLVFIHLLADVKRHVDTSALQTCVWILSWFYCMTCIFATCLKKNGVCIDQSHQWIGLASYEWRRLLVYEGFRCAYAPVASPARIARPTLGFCNKSILWPPLLPGITSGTQKEDSLSNMFPLVESFRRLISRSLVIRVSIFKI